MLEVRVGVGLKVLEPKGPKGLSRLGPGGGGGAGGGTLTRKVLCEDPRPVQEKRGSGEAL